MRYHPPYSLGPLGWIGLGPASRVSATVNMPNVHLTIVIQGLHRRRQCGLTFMLFYQRRGACRLLRQSTDLSLMSGILIFATSGSLHIAIKVADDVMLFLDLTLTENSVDQKPR